MSPLAEPRWFCDEPPRIARHCPMCGKLTPHEVRFDENGALAACVTCLTHAIRRDLEAV